ncbi:adenylyl-sulfate kinase [uncultured Maribacter sp.]|uniref:adenylyl-sulfate kinase n=1 Tax=uncultured Maribacter sp. TaxID=431308 RepID=UPI0030DA9D43
MIYSLYGQPASGKTVLGRMLAAAKMTTYHIDGDEFRNLFSNKNYGKEGRRKNITAANAVATYLNKTQEEDVVISLVNPYEDLRNELKSNNQNQVVEVLLTSTRELRKEYHVEDFEMGNPKITINTDRPVESSFDSLMACIAKREYY